MTGPANGPTGGWIKLWRRYTSADHPHHPINTGEPMSKWGAWIDLLGQAQWSDDGDLEAGQLQASRSYLQRRWNWTEKEVRVYLSNLEDEGQIETHHPGGRAPSIITVCNWSGYQGSDADQGADQEVDAPSWQGPEKGPTKGPANGPGKGQQTPRNDGENPGSGASKRPARGPAQGPEKGPEVKKYKKKEEKQQGSAPADAGAGSGPDGLDQTSLFAPPDTDTPESLLEQQVREVDAHWIALVADLNLTSEERQVLLSAKKREHARSKFRARIRDDGFGVEELQEILSWALSRYWNEDDRLPWGGNVHPKSIIQNGDKARERLLRMRQSGNRTRQKARSSPSTLEGDELEELQRRREERLRRERERVAASQ